MGFQKNRRSKIKSVDRRMIFVIDSGGIGGKMRKMVSAPLVFYFVCFVASAASASVIDANFSTEFYGYKVKIPEDQDQIRSLQGVRLGIHDAFVPGLSLYARGRVASDLSNKFSTDPDWRVFGAYLQYSPSKAFSAKAGRQYVSAGLGGITLDGGRLDLFYRDLTLTGYVGTTPGPSFFNYDAINGWDKSNAYGGRLKYSGLKWWTFGLSFLERNYSGNLDSRVGGFDFSYSRGNCSEFGRIDYEILQKKVKLVTIRPSLRLKQGHSIGLEYLYRRPTFGLSSIFSVFKNEPFHQVRVNPILKINENVYGLGSLAYTRYEDDDNIRISAGASYRSQSGGVVFSDGYGGARLGIFASVNRKLSENLSAYLFGDMFNYKLDTNEDDTTPSLAASLGANCQVLKEMNVRGEVQLLSNRDYKYDTRFYVKADYTLRMSQADVIGGGGYR